MTINCIKTHYSPASWNRLIEGKEYEFIGIKVEHDVVYVTIINESRRLDFPAKYFFTKDIIRDILLDKLLDTP